ncbi:MAG: hypothetical protein V7L11_30315 [Nostoc sp.]|uniref:hypothetical protein n=1 Tax=Nostoc sp. TaxID=1180 RepID=UPI002FFD0440
MPDYNSDKPPSQCSGIRDSTITDSGRGEGDKGDEKENSRLLTSNFCPNRTRTAAIAMLGGTFAIVKNGGDGYFA